MQSVLPTIGSSHLEVVIGEIVIVDVLKNRLNKGKISNLYFYRDEKKNEIDLLLIENREFIPIEIKTATTFSVFLLNNNLRLKRVFWCITVMTENYQMM